MDKIIIPLNGKTAAEIENGEFFHSIPWDALMPHINQMASVRPYEKIDGLIVSETDIQVRISQKRGPKTKV